MPPDLDIGAGFGFGDDLPLTRDAIAFAQEHHDDQRRAGNGALFLIHPLEVSSILKRSQYPDYVVAAGVLHDVLEDTDAERSDLRARFGPEVAELVALVSDDPTIGDEEQRKDEVRERVRRADGYALAVYAADKVSKVRELRILIASGLDRDVADVKLRRYRKSLEMVEQAPAATDLVELLRFEVEALERLPPEQGKQVDSASRREPGAGSQGPEQDPQREAPDVEADRLLDHHIEEILERASAARVGEDGPAAGDQ